MRLLSLLCLLAACGGTPPVAIETPEPVGVSIDAWKAHVDVLASDAYLGRGTGEEGTRLAADYAAKHFESLGLQPRAGDDDFFAPVSFYAVDWDPSTTLSVQAEDSYELALGKDFKPFDFSDEGEISAELVFAGYGIQAEEHEWDDYEGLDVEGKIVVLLRHEPRENDESWDRFAGAETTDHSAFLAKARVASELGAVGMILATDPLNHEPGDDFRGRNRLMLDKPDEIRRGESQGPQFLAVHASQAQVSKMLSSTGKSLKELQEAVDSGTKPSELAAQGVSASLVVKAGTEAVEVADRNVVAVLPGTDPELADEVIVIGAHYDHLGAYEGEGDTIYNGADDNASGTAGVLELARVLAADPQPRSVVFALFTGEEKGLLGSKLFVRDEQIAIDDVVFMLNLDMISRNGDKPADVLGEAYSTGLQEVVQASADEAGLEVEFGGTNYAGNSDHDSFYRVNVPFMFFFTGLHSDYHQLSDHVDTVDTVQADKVLKASHGVVRRLASTDTPPTFIHHLSWLGVSVRTGEQGAYFATVDEESRAEEAGLQVGDVLQSMDGSEMDADGVGEALQAVEPGTLVNLVVMRGEETTEVAVERAKTGYFGVYPGGVEDEVKKKHGLLEGEGFSLRQVVEEGPAGNGGLLAGDIVYRVNGMPVDMRSLGRRLARIGAGETVKVDLIRGDERMELEVVLGERPQR